MDKYMILQLRKNEDIKYELFSSLKDLSCMDMKPDINHYEAVFQSSFPPYRKINELLEDIYMEFNLRLPKDFNGHSLSVSDVIAVKEDNKIRCYYVDSIGFQELPGFMSQEDYKRITEDVL